MKARILGGESAPSCLQRTSKADPAADQRPEHPMHGKDELAPSAYL
jgi:hypothetical protein